MSVTLDEEEDVVYGLDTNGRPDPAYALALGMVPASAGRRSAAFSIDAAIVVLLTLPLSLGTLPLWFSVIMVEPTPSPLSIISDDAFIAGAIFYAIGQGTLSVFVLVQLILHGIRGVTVGKAMVGIRSVNVAQFTKPGFWRIVLRAIVFWTALAIIPILGAVPFLLSPLWDSEKRGRGWLDKIGRNWLLDVRRGLDPFDQKALRHARRRLDAPQVVPEVHMPSLATGAAGAVTSFVPAGRSRSGVISAQSFGDTPASLWQPPPVGEGEPISAVLLSSPPAHSVLQFDDGMRVDVTGVGILGRAPAPLEGEAIDHLVAVIDESMRISKTHAAFGVDGRGLWVTDRGSSNGTTVTPPGGATISLVPWERSYVSGNTVVDVGGRSFTVVEGSNMNGRNA
jgi:uncharacterized RDD family membrane protein YckC